MKFALSQYDDPKAAQWFPPFHLLFFYATSTAHAQYYITGLIDMNSNILAVSNDLDTQRLTANSKLVTCCFTLLQYRFYKDVFEVFPSENLPSNLKRNHQKLTVWYAVYFTITILEMKVGKNFLAGFGCTQCVKIDGCTCI